MVGKQKGRIRVKQRLNSHQGVSRPLLGQDFVTLACFVFLNPFYPHLDLLTKISEAD